MRLVEYDMMASVEEAHWWYRGLRKLVVESLVRRGVQSDTRQIIVDIGCGTGGGYLAIRRRFPEVSYVGIDVEPKALSHCRQRGLGAVIRASTNQVPLRSECTDVIICLDVLCYASISPTSALQQFYESLRPGGLLILNLPALEVLRGQHDLAVGIHRRFHVGEVRSLVQAAGFTLVTSTYWNMVLFPAMLVWRLLSLRNRDGDETSDLGCSPRWLNPALGAILWVEVTMAQWLSLPLGSSVFVVAQKPESGGSI